MTTAFEIVAYQKDSVACGGREYPPETIFVGPDIADAAFDLAAVAEIYAADRSLAIRRLTRRHAYLSDGDVFLSLFVREEAPRPRRRNR